ncbi:MAG: alpha/beta hydrolase [Deltaproteobacteria bacterium]|nr:alpha/beta hydrolase [Deltaproteobacteria bacterium]
MKLWDAQLEGYRDEARNMLQFLPALIQPDASLDARSRARQIREGFQTVTANAPKSAKAVATTIPGPAGPIPVRLFRPKGKARGLYLHIHGGGWILGTPEMGDATNERLADRFDLAVLSVDYRLAPEHPYPAGPDDCQAAAAWLLEKGQSEFGSDRLFIGGESAGGHLTLVTGLRVRDRLKAADRLLGLNLVFGWYDVNGTPSQAGNGGHPDMLDPGGLRFMVECFTPGMSEQARRAPDISPLYAPLAGLPSTLISVGSFDHLRDDSLFLAPLLACAGVDVELQVFPDSPHGFQALPTKMSAAFNQRSELWVERVMKTAGV